MRKNELKYNKFIFTVLIGLQITSFITGCGENTVDYQNTENIVDSHIENIVNNLSEDSVNNHIENELNDESEVEEAESELQGNQEIIEYTTLEEARVLSENDIINVNPELVQDFFCESEITDEIFERIYGKSFKVDCTVPREDLRYVRVLFYGFDRETHIGGVIVNQKISKDIVDIFYQLYINNYEIESMTLVDEFDADDDKSMKANNTSSFNYRTIAGSTKLSNHSLGMAIDINPLYNPYVKTKPDGTVIISPDSAVDYIDREAEFEHKITSEDLCCKLFKEHGFTWGGDYNSLKDYQHFEKE